MENRNYIENIDQREIYKEKDYKHAYASFGLRALAFIIDMIIVGAISNIIKSFNLVNPEAMIYNISFIDMISGFVTLAYFTIASLNSDDLTVSQIIIREICGRFIQNKLFLLYALPIFTPKNQGLIDFFVDTAVVKEEAIRDLYGKEF